MTGVRQWCGVCGLDMARRGDGAWTPGCVKPGCHKPGYWSTARSAHADQWAHPPTLLHFRDPESGMNLTLEFYPGPDWPWHDARRRKPCLPRGANR